MSQPRLHRNRVLREVEATEQQGLLHGERLRHRHECAGWFRALRRMSLGADQPIASDRRAEGDQAVGVVDDLGVDREGRIPAPQGAQTRTEIAGYLLKLLSHLASSLTVPNLIAPTPLAFYGRT